MTGRGPAYLARFWLAAVMPIAFAAGAPHAGRERAQCREAVGRVIGRILCHFRKVGEGWRVSEAGGWTWS